MGRFTEAIADFTQALLDEEPDVATYTRRAAAYLALDEKDAATQDLEKALALPCKDEGDHYGRAVALVLSDRIPEALTELERAFADLSNRVFAMEDDLLAPVRDLPEFKALLEKAA